MHTVQLRSFFTRSSLQNKIKKIQVDWASPKYHLILLIVLIQPVYCLQNIKRLDSKFLTLSFFRNTLLHSEIHLLWLLLSKSTLKEMQLQKCRVS